MVGFGVGRAKDKDVIIAETDERQEDPDRPGPLRRVTARGGKGHALARKAKVVRVDPARAAAPPPTLLN